MYGYMGKLLFINLTTGEAKVEPLKEEDALNFLGGPGLGAKILYERMPAHADVFGEDSMLGFVSGPLNNTDALFGGRYTVVSKSPVTGGWNDANSGGFFGERLRQSGYDAIFVSGISPKPVYILVDGGDVQILDATNLWGLKTGECEERLKKKYGKNAGVAQIGPAGEHLSYIAAIMNDEHRAAARGGSGAVMGSKKLKAVVVRGKAKTPIADAKKFSKIQWEIMLHEAKLLITDPAARDFFGYGTGGTFEDSVSTGDTGVKNWSATNLIYTREDAAKQSSHGLKKYRTKKFRCSSCHVGCSYYMEMDTKSWGRLKTTRPEYEAMGAFGPLMLNKDVESVCMANELCNQYGFDTISAGSTIAWAMECYENGFITHEDLNGVHLEWGNGDAIVEVLKMMGEGQTEMGRFLAMGSREAANQLKQRKGEEFKGEEFLVVANGIEQPQHDARYLYGLGRTYMADPTPGRHVKAAIGNVTTEDGFDPDVSLRNTGEDDVNEVINTEIMNSSGSCAFGYDYGNPNEAIFRSIEAITGHYYDSEEKRKLGLRLFTMRQAFNLREGIRRSSFTISKRMTTPPFNEALGKKTLKFDLMIDSLYDVLGWDNEGVPSEAVLRELGGLDLVMHDLYGDEAAAKEGKIE
ncbi:MAG: aldehyde ferredoxin oxidoreductase family protein [Acetatifactor sp.]|nr:aldehyde ferredoxin oxidoreductase family protein [Acetatifactor sp.]